MSNKKMTDFKQMAEQYRSELLDRVVPFWLNKSQDLEYGGYYTCLDRWGGVYDTDKFIWLQAREVWMFAKLYNTVEPRQEWLDAAKQGAEFLRRHGHDGLLNWYFAVERDGTPLVQPYNIFSYTFATIAFGQLSLALKAAGGHEQLADDYAKIAKRTFDNVLCKAQNPKGQWSKAVPGGRAMKTFDLPMILCNVALEIESLVERQVLEGAISHCLHEVLEVFYRPELGLVVEAVGQEGQLIDCFDGRKLNPGHAIEAMWFVMDLGKRLNRPELIDQAIEICLHELEYGWDQKYGGIFYFMDRLGQPRHELEWDQKLWWVHIEALISLSKGYALTGDKRCLAWFLRVHEYTWAHFRDPLFPEWYGYLNRQGEVLLPLKGGKWKGCFHVPRGLLNVWRTLESIAGENKQA